MEYPDVHLSDDDLLLPWAPAGSAGVMSIIDFAKQHRLKLRRDTDGSDIIRGIYDESHIYECNENEMGVMFITPATKPARPFFWRKHRDSGIATGMRSTVESATYGTCHIT